MRMRTAFWLILLAATLGGSFPMAAQSLQPSRWNVTLQGRTGPHTGSDICRTLEYFSGSPFLFDYDHDLVSTNPHKMQVKTEVTPLGDIKGRKIVQVVQNINDGELLMKRLLVQRDKGTYCAIFQLAFSVDEVALSPATITQVNAEKILATRDRNGRHSWNEAYWTFDTEGPILLDLKVIDSALKNLLPSGYEVRWDYGLNMDALCYQSIVWKEGECNACASGGSVSLQLGFRDHRLIVVNKHYDPDPNHQPASCVP
jgi:hypothetical protein